MNEYDDESDGDGCKWMNMMMMKVMVMDVSNDDESDDDNYIKAWAAGVGAASL